MLISFQNGLYWLFPWVSVRGGEPNCLDEGYRL